MIEENLAIYMDYDFFFKNLRILLSFVWPSGMVYKNQVIFLIFKEKKNGNRKRPKATFFELIFYSTSEEMLLIKKGWRPPLWTLVYQIQSGWGPRERPKLLTLGLEQALSGKLVHNPTFLNLRTSVSFTWRWKLPFGRPTKRHTK